MTKEEYIEAIKCCANCKHFLEPCEIEPEEQEKMKDRGYCYKWEIFETTHKKEMK